MVLKRTGRIALILAFSVCLDAQTERLRQAARLDEEGKCDEAEAIYRAALAQNTPSAALLNNVGNHYLACGQPAKAKRYFQRLIQTHPEHANANLQLARIAVEQKHGKEALAYLEHVKEFDLSVVLLRAEALHWAGQPRQALTLLAEVEKQAAADPRLLFLAGLTFARLGLYSRAEDSFSNALSHSPGDYEILFNLGRAAARAGHYDRAQRALDAALRIQPDDVNVLVELGRVSAAQQDPHRAAFLLAKARQLAPGNAEIALLLAHAAEDAGYFEDAAAAYDEYVRLHPADDAARRDRARAYGSTETLREQSRKELAWYLDKHPRDPLAHYIFARIFWESEPDLSVFHLTEAVRLEPDSAAYRFARAWMLQRTGNMAGSLPDLQVALRLEPGNPRILDLVGLANLALEHPDDAERAFRAAVLKAPNDPELLLHLGRALMALGREDEAGTYLKKYQEARPAASPPLRGRFGILELAALPASEQRTREIDHFRTEARNHPDRPEYQLRLSSLLLAEGKRDESFIEFRKLAELNATVEIWGKAGSLLLAAGEPGLAREFLERAPDRPSARLDLAVALFHTAGAATALEYLGKVPDAASSGDVLLLKARFLESAGRATEARQALDLALRQPLSRPAAVQEAAVLLQRLKRDEDALQLTERAAREHPADPEVLLTQAIVLAMMNRTQPAEQKLRQLESRWPEWDRSYVAHGLLLEGAGRLDEARQLLRTALALGSREPGLQCALARLAPASAPSANCACSNGLMQLLDATCREKE